MGKKQFWFSSEGWQVSPFMGRPPKVKAAPIKNPKAVKNVNKEFYNFFQKPKRLTKIKRGNRLTISCHVFGNRASLFWGNTGRMEEAEKELKRVNDTILMMYKKLKVPVRNNDKRLVEYVKSPTPELWGQLLKDYKRL